MDPAERSSQQAEEIMAIQDFKPTPKESRRMLLAILTSSLGGTIAFCSFAALVKMHASWSYAGLAIGIAIWAFGLFRTVTVRIQIGAAHQNDKPDPDGATFDLRHRR
jgi:hypothetical protein